jgi:hypothetical protein
VGVREAAAIAAEAGVGVSVVAEQIELPFQPVGRKPGLQHPDATAALQHLAARTGGLLVEDPFVLDPLERPGGLKCGVFHADRALEAVIARLRSAYTLEIDLPPAATARELEIRVRASGGVVRARSTIGASGR